MATSRLVLLGASNLTPALGMVAALGATGWAPGPVELLAAAGHGRAYATWSRFGLRELPPIAGTGLWSRLAGRPLPTRAVVADVGNDLVYGVTPERTLEAVAGCLERLVEAGADTVLTLPPVASVARLARWRFLLFRSLLFPGRGFSQQRIVRRLEQVSAGLRRLAVVHGVRLAELEPSWLRADAIHLRRAARRTAWSTVCGGWRAAPPTPAGHLPVRWSFLAAERSRLLGWRLGRAQPAARRPNGSSVWFY